MGKQPPWEKSNFLVNLETGNMKKFIVSIIGLKNDIQKLNIVNNVQYVICDNEDEAIEMAMSKFKESNPNYSAFNCLAIQLTEESGIIKEKNN